MDKLEALAACEAARWTNALVPKSDPESEYAAAWRKTVLVDAMLAGCSLAECGRAIGLSGERVRGIVKNPGQWPWPRKRIRLTSMQQRAPVARREPEPKHQANQPPRSCWPRDPTLAEYREALMRRRLREKLDAVADALVTSINESELG